MKQFKDAVAAYEDAAKIDSKKPSMQFALASAYVLAGEREKAAATFARIKDLAPDREMLNNAAYAMAKADLQLPQALEFAKKASHEIEEEFHNISLSDLKVQDLRKTQTLAAYWDTLGWVYSRMSNFDGAEQYLRAAWILTQDGTVAGHLCTLYERMHKNLAAIQMCSVALHRLPMSEGIPLNELAEDTGEVQARLNHLVSGPAKTKSVSEASDMVIRERTFKMARFMPGTASAEFFVLLSSDGKARIFKAEDVKFISGSDKMKLQGKQLKTISWNFVAPAGVSTRFVRRGILGCFQYSGCSFVLLDPAAVHSLD